MACGKIVKWLFLQKYLRGVTNLPKLSIIVPIYKSEKYIHNCVDSILNQTFRDFELILVDDGSPDNCGKICDEYANIDSRVRTIHKKYGGVSDARNLGIEKAKGEIIGFVDSDDEIDLNMYKIMIDYLLTNNLDIVCADTYVVRPTRNKKTFRPRYNRNMIFNHLEAINTILDGTLDNAVWNKIYKRSVIGDIRYPKGRVYEDVATTYKYIANADKVGYLCQPLYYYFKRKGSIIDTSFNSKARYDCFLGYRERFYFAINKNLACKQQAKQLALKTALSALTAFYSDKIDYQNEQYKDLCKFIYENSDFEINDLKVKERILLWSFSNCSAIHRIYALLSRKIKKIKNY